MINGPSDLKYLSKEQLNLLASEVRERIIKTLSKRGGHLASSLGVVELTIALHYTFESPRDKIVWDVGHQSYAHKILTGRNKRFNTLRQYKGLSGFPKIHESEHDAFGTGHSSTAISAALGIAVARDLGNDGFKVVAIVGDGALTGGMAFEALNQAGHLKTDLVVVLNDNRMSISPNVGALTSYLRRMVVDPKYHKRRKKAKFWLRMLPRIGSKAAKLANDMEETLRAYTSTPGLLFKELGFSYFGPVDGHDIGELITAFKNIKQLNGPAVLHVVTKKGAGYTYAEQDKTRFHGVGAFNIENGENIKCPEHISYTDAFSNALIKLAQKNRKIVGITAAMATGTGLSAFKERFPERFFDVGIAEQHAVTFAAGLASKGFRPVVAIYSTFLQRAYDQIVHDVCLQNLPVVFAVDRGGLVGEDGATHHGTFDLSYLRHIPNMTVMAPRDENELGHMLNTALQHDGPIALRYPRGCGVGVKMQNPYKKIPIGRFEVIKNGKDLVIFAIGSMVSEAISAAKALKNRKINAAVVNARFVKPLDERLVVSFAKKAKKVITVEENSLQGGFGSAVVELLDKKGVKAVVKRIGIPDRFVEHGSVHILRKKIGLTKGNIIKTALSM